MTILLSILLFLTALVSIVSIVLAACFSITRVPNRFWEWLFNEDSRK